jgi:hypothetical protein
MLLSFRKNTWYKVCFNLSALQHKLTNNPGQYSPRPIYAPREMLRRRRRKGILRLQCTFRFRMPQVSSTTIRANILQDGGEIPSTTSSSQTRLKNASRMGYRADSPIIWTTKTLNGSRNITRRRALLLAPLRVRVPLLRGVRKRAGKNLINLVFPSRRISLNS